MYEAMTYEVILQRMLDRVRDEDPNIDIREGSMIYNALAPAAVELTNMYIQLDVVLNESFADTQSRTYLIKRCAERGIEPYPASKAVLKGVFNVDIQIGSRFSLEELNYIVTEQIAAGEFKLECETAGEAGNLNLGPLIPIDYIEGLTSAQLTEVLIPGEDEEATEDLRKRYFDSLESQAFGGNEADYKDRTNKLAGVGGTKVYPVWNGGGTVKLVIMDATHGVPSAELISTVQTAVDGFAPIGHVVTVVGVAETTVNVATTLTFESGWTWTEVEPYAQTAIDNYFEELSELWDEETLIVRISQIEARFLALTGVLDITGTTINGAALNLTMNADNIPARGTVSG